MALHSLPDLNPLSLYRPHLRPLDLASDSPAFCRPSNVLLTPPLTPSSSLSSQNTPSTPSVTLHQDNCDYTEPAYSRLLLVENVPPSASSDTLKRTFKNCGSIKGILVRFQPEHGIVVIAFYDSRDAHRAKSHVSSMSVDGSPLNARLISSLDLRKMSPGPNTFIDECEGKISVRLEDGHLPSGDIRDLLASFGQLQSFQQCEKSYLAEYFDCRSAQSAVDNLHNMPVSGACLNAVVIHDDGSDSDNSHPSQQPTPVVKVSDFESTKAHVRGLFFNSSGRVRPRSVSAGESTKSKDIIALANAVSAQLSGSSSLLPEPRSPEGENLASQRRASAPDPSYSQPAYSYDYSQSHPHLHHAYLQPYPFGRYEDTTPMAYHHPAYPAYSYTYAPDHPYAYSNLSNWDYSSTVMSHVPQPSAIDYFCPTTVMNSSLSPPFSPVAPSSPISPTTPSRKSFDPLHMQPSSLHTRSPGASAPPSPPERNLLNIKRIEDGLDTRTTVMVKNIPNKMSDKDLLAFLNKVCYRRIDFLYLRMDFQNGCNVGYAFVNFINVQDLLVFAKAKLGVKWNMYSSEKVLQMSYANYQGKEALIEKFKNSCIMDERESYRPKIFYSSGTKAGMPEPFPAPTHLKRKERSSNNRGALFVGSGAFRENRVIAAASG